MLKDEIERFAKRFRGSDRSHGVYKLTGKKEANGKVEGKATTVKEPAGFIHYKEHLEGKIGLGIVPVNGTGTCWFGAIDSDEYPTDIIAIERRVRAVDLPLIPCGTKSGGAHLYLFCKKEISASLVIRKLNEFAPALGLKNCEIFPKQKTLGEENQGNWINTPYFGNTRHAVDNGRVLNLEEFLDLADKVAVTKTALERMKPREDPSLEGAPPCLRILGVRGMIQGQRNDGMFNLAVYLRKRHGGDMEALLFRLKEFNDKCVKPLLTLKELKIIAKSVAQKDYHYTCSQPPISQFCDKGECRKSLFGISKKESLPDLTDLTLVEYDPPLWDVTVNGIRVRSLTIRDLDNPTLFRRRCWNQQIPCPPVSKKNWREYIEPLILAARREEPPKDATDIGRFEEMLDEFLSDYRGRMMAEDPWFYLLSGRATEEPKGTFHFRLADLKKFIETRHRTREFTEKKMADLIKELGGTNKKEDGGDLVKKVQGKVFRYWTIKREYEDGKIEVPFISAPYEF